MLGCFLLTGGYIERDVLEKRFESRATAAIDDGQPSLRHGSRFR